MKLRNYLNVRAITKISIITVSNSKKFIAILHALPKHSKVRYDLPLIKQKLL